MVDERHQRAPARHVDDTEAGTARTALPAQGVEPLSVDDDGREYVRRQRVALRTGATLLIGVALAIATIVVVSLAVLMALRVDLAGDPDHAPQEGIEELTPDEIGDEQTPTSE